MLRLARTRPLLSESRSKQCLLMNERTVSADCYRHSQGAYPAPDSGIFTPKRSEGTQVLHTVKEGVGLSLLASLWRPRMPW